MKICDALRKQGTLAAVAAMAFALPADANSAGMARTPPVLFEGGGPEDEPRDCLEATPAALALPATGPPVSLSVLVLADGIPVEQAATELARTGDAYAGAGVELSLTFRSVVLPPDGKRGHDGPRQYTLQDIQAIKLARQQFLDRRRPGGFDLVYVLTDKDVWSGPEGSTSESDRNYSTVGYASCIGGIRFAERAFAVGELRPAVTAYGLTLAPFFTAETAAHELGHLLGAHHQYAVCGTRAAVAAQARADVCTIMFPQAGPAGLEFSPVNAAIVYGHAREYGQR